MRKYRFNPREVGVPIGYLVLPVSSVFRRVTQAEFQKHFDNNPLELSPQAVCREFLKVNSFPYFPRERPAHATYTALQNDFDISRLDPLIIEFDDGDWFLRDGNHRAFFFFLLHLDNRLRAPYPCEMKVVFTTKVYTKPISEIRAEMYEQLREPLQLFEKFWIES